MPIASAEETATALIQGKSAQVTSTSVKETVQSDSKNEKAKKTSQSIAQGLSVAEAAMLNNETWGFSLATSANRGFDEYADTWSWSTGLDVSYTLSEEASLALSLGYESVLLNYNGDLFTAEVEDPRTYGLADTEIAFSLPSVWGDKYNRLMVVSTLTLPTSTVSQRASLIASGNVTASLRYAPNEKFTLTPQVGTYLSSFQYETADRIGNKPNSPYGVSYGLSAAYVFLPWLTANVSYGQVLRYDFYEDWRVVQTGSAQLSASLTDNLAGNLGYRWRDRTISNDSMFDDDKSLILTGVTYAF